MCFERLRDRCYRYDSSSDHSARPAAMMSRARGGAQFAFRPSQEGADRATAITIRTSPGRAIRVGSRLLRYPERA